jgi:DNA-binding LacI/PurR family transcriptional regulator
VTRGELLKVAAAAGVDPRTVARLVDGEAARSSATLEAVRLALEVNGFKQEARRLGKKRTA